MYDDDSDYDPYDEVCDDQWALDAGFEDFGSMIGGDSDLMGEY